MLNAGGEKEKKGKQRQKRQGRSTSLADGEGGVVVPDGGAGVGGPEAGVVAAGRAVLQEPRGEIRSDRGSLDSRREGGREGARRWLKGRTNLVRIHGWLGRDRGGIGSWRSCAAWGKGAMVVDDKDEECHGEEAMQEEKYNGGRGEEDGFVLRSLSIRLPVHVDLFTISPGRRKGPLADTEPCATPMLSGVCACHEQCTVFFFLSFQFCCKKLYCY